MLDFPTKTSADAGFIFTSASGAQWMWDGIKWDSAEHGTAGGGGGGFPDATPDNITYGRENNAWNPVLPLDGGTMSGPITLSADAAAAMQPVPLQQLQSTISSLPPMPTNYTSTPPANSAAGSPGTTTTQFAMGNHTHPTDTTRAPIANAALTGNPTAPTPTFPNNTQALATTAYVASAVASIGTPPAPSTTIPAAATPAGSAGTSLAYARGDHSHPTDVTKASLAGATFTGAVTAPAVNSTDATFLGTVLAVNLDANNFGVTGDAQVNGTITAPNVSITDGITFPGYYGGNYRIGWSGNCTRVAINGVDHSNLVESTNCYSILLGNPNTFVELNTGAGLFYWSLSATKEDAIAQAEVVANLLQRIEALEARLHG